MQEFIDLLWACYHDMQEPVLSFDDVESVVDEGLEVEFFAVFEDR